jgi:hypothetical protein
MLRFYADFFVKSLREVSEMADRWKPNDIVIPGPSAVAGKLSALQADCVEHGLLEIAKKCARIMDKAHAKRVTYREVVGDLNELRERLEDELQSRVFLSLSVEEGLLYEKPDDGWQSVIGRFPPTRFNIEECSKCFALERYGAAIFHVMLIAEFGVIEAAKLLRVEGDRPGWSALDRLQKIHDKRWADKSALEQQHAEFLKNLMPLALSMKDSWRHKISHADNNIKWMDADFSPEVANDIISATRGFMRRLALDLPRRPEQATSPYA